MQHEIKFRAWDGEKMRYSFTIGRPQFADCLHVMTDTAFAIKIYRLKDWQVMQFTGIKDKNDVQIYDGDLLKLCYYENDDEPELNEYSIHEVVWLGESGYPGFELVPQVMEGMNGLQAAVGNWGEYYPIWCEVIGNKYQDSHLLAEIKQ